MVTVRAQIRIRYGNGHVNTFAGLKAVLTSGKVLAELSGRILHIPFDNVVLA